MVRDRYGRVPRADGDPARRPGDGFRARDRDRFAQLARDAVALLPAPVRSPLSGATLVVEDLPPPPRGLAWEEVALAAFQAAPPGRLVLYRRPLELRAESRADLVDAIRDAAGAAVALELGLPWEDAEDE